MADSTVLFGRKYRVTIDNFQFSDLDVTFSVKKTLTATPNTVSLTVYNLNESHRSQLEQLQVTTVLIEAGYGDKGMSSIFLGDLRVSESGLREGPDWVTTLSAGDGEKAFRTSRVNKSFKRETTADDVLRNVAEAIGVGAGNLNDAVSKLKLGNIGNLFCEGTVLSGSASREMSWICKSVGLTWSIQNGKLQLLPLKTALDGEAIVIQESTGMVGSPTVDNKGILHVKTLMTPDVFPGRKAVVKSLRINGQYRIEVSTHTGDSKGNDWYCDIEAKRY